MHNLKARAHIIHIHIRYAENNSNMVKTRCLLIPLNDPFFPATNRSKSCFRSMITKAHGSCKRIIWQDYVFLIADCVKCETSYERRQFLSTCINVNACRVKIKIINAQTNPPLLPDQSRHSNLQHYKPHGQSYLSSQTIK